MSENRLPALTHEVFNPNVAQRLTGFSRECAKEMLRNALSYFAHVICAGCELCCLPTDPGETFPLVSSLYAKLS